MNDIDTMTPQELDGQIKIFRVMARYDYEKARTLAQPYIDRYNEVCAKIARKYHRSWRKKTFAGYTK